jgi:hypothetical protein
MSVFSAASAQAIQNRLSADRAAARPAERRAAPSATSAGGGLREGDALDISIDTSVTTDAVRGNSGNADEQTREDRQQNDGYNPLLARSGKKRPDGERKHIDLQG